MDPYFLATNFYRKRDFVRCAQICTDILKQDSQHPAWILKVKALTQRVSYDDTDVLENLAEASGDNNQWTNTASLNKSTADARSTKQATTAHRPMTKSRPISGVVRLNRSGLNGSRTNDGQTALKSRAQTGRMLSRLGTASLSTEAESFLNVARLNLAHYASLPHMAKPLFEYIYFVQGDVKTALELANQANAMVSNRNHEEKNHYWKCAIARCLIRLGLVRQIAQTASDWYVHMNNTEGLLLMAKAYIIIDQPLTALDIYRKGLEKFQKDTIVLSGMARIYEEQRQMDDSVSTYKELLNYDCSNTEALACIAAHFFYNGQPEWAFVLYKRLLQMGIHTPEVLCNIGLCCLKTQQYDMIVPCMESAFTLAKDDMEAEIWYNCGHVALGTGNFELAELCWKLSRRINPNHSEACNNLAVLALIDGRLQEGKVLLNAAVSLDNDLAEAIINLDKLKQQDNEMTECLI